MSVKRALIALGPKNVKVVQLGHGLRMVKQHATPVLPANILPPTYPAKPVAQEAFPK